ncbi:SUF system Fe-S cluster assembly regulator [Haematospirillum jordaniae]|uniref:SUF system Fe-S cluster assembly regulator n=1 Tax=Haematospirillum jordaniae TaxID=1549855 RepID=UPI0014330AE7|nr:SUF system Fe-S cluster assembly regulator [Haematospirillum jordaniae]NKD84706.1 SUF system Fe-S cluster assembly regulator [Haematospirillum jordaniae]
MLRINKLTDYAVVLLVYMVKAGGRHSAQQVAGETGIPMPTVAKILKTLTREGLVVSTRGVSGGYCLGRGAEQITVADIVQAVEGPIALTSCVDESPDGCGIGNLCPMNGHWNRVNGAVYRALSDVTLADMASDPLPFVPRTVTVA